MEQKKIPVVAVVGPTASGKTALAVSIAKQFDGEVVSADSMQIYKGMDIATAKPSPEEMMGIPHHFLSFLEPAEPFSVADYAASAHRVIAEINSRGKLPILAGGTGLYIDSVLEDIRFGETKHDMDLRRELIQFEEKHGAPSLWERLRGVDPEAAEKLHPNDTGRIIRAIEVYELTGIPMSEHRRKSRGESRYRVLKIGLSYRDREILYGKIERRVDQMIEQGLLKEAEAFFRMDRSKTAAQAIGYKELAGYFEGRLGLDEAVENLKRETRRYAKRQMTWFRKDSRIIWFYPDEKDYAEIEKNIYAYIDKFRKMCYD